MITNFTMFETDEDLEKLTGLSNDELWENGFNLDDWDWGFCCDIKYNETEKDENDFVFRTIRDDAPEYASHLLYWMDNYCCGYEVTEYNGKYYYILHHA